MLTPGGGPLFPGSPRRVQGVTGSALVKMASPFSLFPLASARTQLLPPIVGGRAVVAAGSTVVTVVVAGGGCVTSASISPRAEGRSQRREGRTPTEESPVNSAIAPISDRLRLIDAYLYTT